MLLRLQLHCNALYIAKVKHTNAFNLRTGHKCIANSESKSLHKHSCLCVKGTYKQSKVLLKCMDMFEAMTL